MLKNIVIEDKKRVICYLKGVFHFDLFRNILQENPDIDFFIHSDSITVDEYRKSNIYELSNVYLVTDLKRFKYKLNLFGAFITVDAQAASPHNYSLELIRLFNKMRVPVFELQHGLFQLGLHYYDCPVKENIHADSLPTTSFADHVLTYYPISNYSNTTQIGYPPYCRKLDSFTGNYVLILSNLHWDTYTPEEKYYFYKTMCQFAAENPDKTFIWKMHHGEKVNGNCHSMIKTLFSLFPTARKNIIFYHENEFLNKSSTTELIQKAQTVISTVSTVLLDCDMCKKKTVTFSSPAVKCLIERMKQPQAFTNLQELKELLAQPENHFSTGLLYKYDNEAFRKILNKLYKHTELSNKEFLDIVLDFKK